jgi:predicted  nucleic acid-binding Zn-ribbon protein
VVAADLTQLLLVQERDTTIDQLRHRRATLPERDDLQRLEQRMAELGTELETVRARRAEIATRQSDVEAELAALEERLAELNKRMYSGTITASRDLQAMADEVDHLKRRRSSLEDVVLEAMDEAEPVDAEVARLEAEQADAEAAADRVRAVIGEAERAIAAEEADEAQARAELVATLPAALTEQYERIRTKLGGIGAAKLVGASCSGCHLTLPAVEVDRLKRAPADEIVLCDQCGRILVR